MMSMKGFRQALNDLESKGLLRNILTLGASHGAKVEIEGEPFINFCSNDYLNLSVRTEIIEAASDAMQKYGFGSGSSRLLSGTLSPHKRLEERIARFKGTGSALLFNSGYAANTGIIPAVAGQNVVIFSDELNHSSIIDGIRLSKASVKVYRHKDTAHLEELLKKSASNDNAKQRLIITDTVFSMDGDIAPLKDLHMLSKKYGASLLIDDAHATCILGKGGRGGLEHFAINDDEVIQMGTLSKAFGCYGGFVAGTKDLTDYLTNSARSFIFSTSLPPAVAEAAVAAIDIVDNDPDGLRDRLLRNADLLRNGMNGLGFDTLGSETQIIPLLAGEAEDAIKIADHLYNNSILALPIRPPSVKDGTCRIRFSVTSAHTKDDISQVLEVLKEFKG
jgi:glycine C-acetyltransferase